MGSFYRSKEGGTKKFKKWIISGRDSRGRQGHLIWQVFSTGVFSGNSRPIGDWFKIPLVGKAETAIRLVINFVLVAWLSKSDSIMGLLVSLFVYFF